MGRPKLNSLRAFEVSARHLNFRLAAEELHVTQGAVAQQIRGLEADLGVRLFERLPRGLALTDKGRRYHEQVANALRQIDDATRALQADDREVTVSVPPSFATKWLVPRLPEFSREHPEITLKVLAEDRIVDFRSGRADVAVRQGRRPQETGLKIETLARVELIAVAAKQYPVTAREFETVADFSTHDLVQDGHGHWERLFRAAGIEHRGRILNVNQTALALDAAIAGQGIALVPCLYLQDVLDAGVLQTLWRPDRRADDAFYVLHPETSGAATAAVAKWVLERARTVDADA